MDIDFIFKVEDDDDLFGVMIIDFFIKLFIVCEMIIFFRMLEVYIIYC